MPILRQSKAALRLFGDSLVPNEVTAMLGSQPSESEVKCEVLISAKSGRRRIAKTGSWRLQARDREPGDLNAQVDELLSEITDDLDVWTDLKAKFQIDLFCGFFMGDTNEGIEMSPQTLLKLGERGIELKLDIYAGDEDEKL